MLQQAVALKFESSLLRLVLMVANVMLADGMVILWRTCQTDRNGDSFAFTPVIMIGIMIRLRTRQSFMQVMVIVMRTRQS